MQPKNLSFAITASLLALASCSPSYHESPARSAAADTQETVADSAVSGTMALNDPARRIIHTADINCRVKDVYNATASLETMVTSVGGQVMESHMENQRSALRLQPYASDSLRQVQEYTTASHLSVRVPVRRLDTVIRAVAASADFIESRNLKLEDVTFEYLDNKLMNESGTDLTDAALKHSKKTGDVLDVSQYADDRKTQAIDRRIANMSINDKVNYATFTIDFSQPARVDALIVPDTERLMEPGLGQRLRAALHGSIMLLQSMLVFFVSVWPLLLVIALLVWMIRYYARKSQLRGKAA